jgi:hypothetical protein
MKFSTLTIQYPHVYVLAYTVRDYSSDVILKCITRLVEKIKKGIDTSYDFSVFN